MRALVRNAIDLCVTAMFLPCASDGRATFTPVRVSSADGTIPTCDP